MGKNKLEKFADMASYPRVFEYPYSAVDNVPFEMKGNWHQQFFKNDNPIVLELGCGRGEYTVGLGRMFPDKNFIGVDIKGARMWTGATESLQSGMKNVASCVPTSNHRPLLCSGRSERDMAHVLRPADEESHQTPYVHLLHGTLPQVPERRRHYPCKDRQQLHVHLHQIHDREERASRRVHHRDSTTPDWWMIFSASAPITNSSGWTAA